MDIAEFKRSVSCFADSPASVDISKGDFVVQLRDELIAASLERVEGDLYVREHGARQLARSWIVQRIAKLPLLADRILSAIPETPNFVVPRASVLASLEINPDANSQPSSSAIDASLEIIGSAVPGTTNVVYLTSDAGEGKTTLISELARKSARSYKEKRTSWLLLPVALGGRAFLRFDDVVVSSLMNRFRFPYWFYDGFVELVRMGVVVPAFDGFEEMIVEGPSGEAVSAIGYLVRELRSEGSVLVAARRAFFEYQSFKTQARLFDAIGNEDSADFSRIALERWSRDQFLEYGHLRGQSGAEAIYDQVAAKFGTDHPLLTRAVLVRRLFDVSSSVGHVEALIEALGQKPQDYFHQFVLAIIEREAKEKWVDKVGREGDLLLSVDEHVDLLASVAREMWVSTTDVLGMDVVDAVSEIFCEESGKSPIFSRQVKDKLRHHALLVSVSGGRPGLSFDHEDFRQFFTGLALSRSLMGPSKEEMRSFLRVSGVPDDAANEAVHAYIRADGDRGALIRRLLDVCKGESSTSFVLENAGKLVVRLLDGYDGLGGVEIRGLGFGSNSLRARVVRGVRFVDCYFAPTSLFRAELVDVTFESCKWERLELSDQSHLRRVRLLNCDVLCVVDKAGDTVAFDPATIGRLLVGAGFGLDGEEETERPENRPASIDAELMIVDKVLRAFLRATQVNEATIRVRLGTNASLFFDVVMPVLEEVGILVRVLYKGSGTQLRFRLGRPMQELQQAIAQARGSFSSFVNSVR